MNPFTVRDATLAQIAPTFNVNGRPVTLRLLTPADAERERRFLDALTTESRRQRFLGQMGHASDALIAHLTDIDGIEDLAIAAVVGQGKDEEIIGVARYSLDAFQGQCECAVVVADAWQRHGIAVRMMQALIDFARARGIAVMYSRDAASNFAMKDLARFLGFSRRIDPDDATLVIHELDLTPTSERAASAG